MNTISDLITKWNSLGIQIPHAKDSVTGKPSITLLFSWITFLIACASLIILHVFPALTTPCWTSIIFWVIASVFYLIGPLHKMEVNLKQESIELDGQESKPKDETPAQ